jgi:hypothetical protein
VATKGFGKISPSSKKGTKPARTKKYKFNYLSSDGVLNIVYIEATSEKQASEQFSCFVKTLETCLLGDTVELKKLVDRHLVAEVIS